MLTATKSGALTLCFSALLSCCACFAPAQIEADRPYRTGTLEHYTDGTLRKARLMEPADVAGHPVAEGSWVRFLAKGVIHGVRLDRDHEISGRVIPASSFVWFDEQGAMATTWLSRDFEFDGVPCNGGPMKVATGFYPDGTLRYAFLSKNADIQGLPCASSVFSGVKFHPNGQLASANSPATARIGASNSRMGSGSHWTRRGTWCADGALGPHAPHPRLQWH